MYKTKNIPQLKKDLLEMVDEEQGLIDKDENYDGNFLISVLNVLKEKIREIMSG